MNSRDRATACLRHERVDRVPRDLWHLPGVEMFRKPELDALLQRFPIDFTSPAFRYGTGDRTYGVPNRVGEYSDEWGCIWTVAEDGVVGEVKHSPLADWSAFRSYQPPWEVLEHADFSRTNQSCAATDKFVRGNSSVRLFERMQFLRGTEELFIDLAYLPAELYALRDMLHEYYLREIELWCKTDVDGVFFMDDWGSQANLLIDPDLWRHFFAPCYREYCRAISGAGKFVFFHSDGNIQSIYGDLVDIGVDAVNSQLFCMDLDELARAYRGKITFWGEICRQTVLPFGTPAEVRTAVMRIRGLLGGAEGGVIAHCEWGNTDPRENIEAVFEAWDEPYR